VLICDVISKVIVVRELAHRASAVRLIGDFVRLIYVRNSGSAFSLFQGGRLFFISFSIISILLILGIARSPRGRTPGYSLALGLILGGAFGNLVDRIAYGSVVDWIDVGIGFHRWPTFNVADIGVSVGVCLLALLMLRRKDDPEVAPGGAAS
jgi:signal peptidase II